MRAADLPQVDDVVAHPLARLLAPAAVPDQPPLLDLPPAEVNAAVATLALGGAERIVLDWAARTAGRHRVRLVVLRDAPDEWSVPRGIEVIRLHGNGAPDTTRLAALGAAMAAGGDTSLPAFFARRWTILRAAYRLIRRSLSRFDLPIAVRKSGCFLWSFRPAASM